MSRELRFNIIMLSLKVLRHGTVLTAAGQYRLKNQMLSAALSWFSFAPCFTFGGNRLQLKAEVKLLSDVAAGLDSVRHIGAKNSSTLKRLQDKEELLFALLENEQSRLRVWLDPFAEGKVSHHAEPSEAIIARLVKTAWFVSPSLAISLATRFHSARVHTDVRNLLLADPLKGINDPEGLNILMGGEYQSDLTWQLKVCTFSELSRELLTVCSIYCFGPQSILSRQSRTFCLHLATTHSLFNMLCVLWKAIVLRWHSFMCLRLYSLCAMIRSDTWKDTLWRLHNFHNCLPIRLYGT